MHLGDWLIHFSASTYADDTGTSIKSKNLDELELEEDAINVLNFMASNGLVANPTLSQLKR